MGIILSGVCEGTTNYNNIEVPEIEGYDGSHELSFYQVQHENAMNDLALFKSMLISDMRENSMLQEGYSEEQILTEGMDTVKNVLEKIKDMFLKLLAKIKNIFGAFIAKLNTFGSDGDALFKKYKTVIAGHSDWKKFKYKIRSEKGEGITKIEVVKLPDFAKGLTSGSGSTGYKFGDVTKFDKTEEEIEEDVIAEVLARYKDASKVSDLKKVMMDEHFEDEEEKTGESDFNEGAHFITLCGSKLQGMKKLISKTKDILASLDTVMKKRISELTKYQGKVIDLSVSKDSTKTVDSLSLRHTTDDTTGKYKLTAGRTSRTVANPSGLLGPSGSPLTSDVPDSIGQSDAKNVIKIVGILQKYTQAEQRVVTAYSTNYMSMVKFDSAQIKRIWTSAAAFATLRKESFDLIEAIGESAQYEAEDHFSSLTA